ncbi:ABC transporter ATP-binding protein [Collinsella sp. An2]|uniref:ABC transporter ATP-binding protein n=1 Tax=Collinsella sp. An2 TaxID=1965585 RepID=UPI000B38D285|nr:ABC transporter ATP-binding protein [Collinsella sp. An2]OUP08625.1 nitrate ABC transporter ATP-binding protein [Collinsella sp. An2]
MARLEVENVSVAFDGLKVLDDVSLVVDSGAAACLLGPSGCGKTTLFHVVAGLSLPDTGRVMLDDADITGHPGKLAYMLQKDLLLPEKTIVDNVSLPLILRGVPRREARAKALEYFDTFGLAGTADRWPAELSGGMRQRAALLRSYLFSQKFMLLDEPFSALDAFTKADMHTWFLDVAERFGTTALMVTHDIDEALEIADVIYVMRGAPQAGEPTRIVGAEHIVCPRGERSGYTLTEEFLEHKRRVLDLLGRG